MLINGEKSNLVLCVCLLQSSNSGRSQLMARSSDVTTQGSIFSYTICSGEEEFLRQTSIVC